MVDVAYLDMKFMTFKVRFVDTLPPIGPAYLVDQFIINMNGGIPSAIEIHVPSVMK